jgi:hypothetical protein
MPGVYKEKNCKYCNKLFRKRGLYCCQACANADRVPTDTMRETMRKVANEYNQTPEAIAKQKMINTPLASMTVEDFAVDIPDIKDLRDYDLDGYERGENW